MKFIHRLVIPKTTITHVDYHVTTKLFVGKVQSFRLSRAVEGFLRRAISIETTITPTGYSHWAIQHDNVFAPKDMTSLQNILTLWTKLLFWPIRAPRNIVLASNFLHFSPRVGYFHWD
jgi:hypothetical protein